MSKLKQNIILHKIQIFQKIQFIVYFNKFINIINYYKLFIIIKY